jgi:hypothetical protein
MRFWLRAKPRARERAAAGTQTKMKKDTVHERHEQYEKIRKVILPDAAVALVSVPFVDNAIDVVRGRSTSE